MAAPTRASRNRTSPAPRKTSAPWAWFSTSIDNIFDYGDTVTWLHGKHILKGGAQILRYQENFYYASNDGTMGEFVYNGIFTKDLTVTYIDTGYGFADFVLDDSDPG